MGWKAEKKFALRIQKKNDLKVKVDIFDLKIFFTWAILLNQKFCEVVVKKEAIKKLSDKLKV